MGDTKYVTDYLSTDTKLGLQLIRWFVYPILAEMCVGGVGILSLLE